MVSPRGSSRIKWALGALGRKPSHPPSLDRLQDAVNRAQALTVTLPFPLRPTALPGLASLSSPLLPPCQLPPDPPSLDHGHQTLSLCDCPSGRWPQPTKPQLGRRQRTWDFTPQWDFEDHPALHYKICPRFTHFFQSGDVVTDALL